MMRAGALNLIGAAVASGFLAAPGWADEAANGAGPHRTEARWAFTRTLETSDGRIVARFDPSRAETGRWALVAPLDAAALTPDQEGLFNSLVAEPDADLVLTLQTGQGEEDEPQFDLESLAASAGSVLRAEGDLDVHAIDPAVFELDEPNLARRLSGELKIDRATGEVRELRIYAERPFKPHPLARLRTFDMSMTFGEVAPGGPTGNLETRVNIAGSAMFQEFDQRTSIVNADFTPVAAE